MNEEVGFIAALFAEPNDRTTLLVYADWLDERDDPRAEYLRLLASPDPNWKRIAKLTSPAVAVCDWVERFKCGCGSVVRLANGAPFTGYMGQVVGAHQNGDKIVVAVRVLFLGGLIDLELDSSMIEHV